MGGPARTRVQLAAAAGSSTVPTPCERRRGVRAETGAAALAGDRDSSPRNTLCGRPDENFEVIPPMRAATASVSVTFARESERLLTSRGKKKTWPAVGDPGKNAHASGSILEQAAGRHHHAARSPINTATTVLQTAIRYEISTLCRSDTCRPGRPPAAKRRHRDRRTTRHRAGLRRPEVCREPIGRIRSARERTRRRQRLFKGQPVAFIVERQLQPRQREGQRKQPPQRLVHRLHEQRRRW